MLATPEELGHIVVIAYGIVFVLVFLFFLFIAFKLSYGVKERIIGSIISLLITVTILIVPFVPKVIKQKQAVQAHKDKYQIAKALFDEKCKTAGEKIYRTVDDVEGVTLLRIRHTFRDSDLYDPMWENAALQRMSADYLFSFLGITHHDKHSGYYYVYWFPEKNEKTREIDSPLYGYQFVDTKEDGSYYRYSLNPGYRAEKNKIPIKTPSRYAVTYDSKIDPNERKHWIATTVITVLDTQTNEILGEKTLVVFDRGLGAGSERKSGRQPWSLAVQCPDEKVAGNAPRFFAEKVLKPKQPIINYTSGE